MALTYNSLVSAITAATENDGSEFTVEIPNFIDRTEQRLSRDLDSWGLTAFAQTTLTPTDPFLSKPTGTLVIKSLQIRRDSGKRVFLRHRTDEYLTRYWPDRTSTSEPKYYADFGFNQLIMAPTPASALVAEMSYVVRPTALSAGHQSNYFSDFAHDALYAGCMYEACMFMKDYEAAAGWEGKYQQAIQMLDNEARRQRRDDRAVPQNPAGGENTKRGDV